MQLFLSMDFHKVQLCSRGIRAGGLLPFSMESSMPDPQKNPEHITLLRLSGVLAEVPTSAASIRRGVRAGTFPAPLKIGPRSVAWTLESIEQWKRDCLAASTKPPRCA